MVDVSGHSRVGEGKKGEKHASGAQPQCSAFPKKNAGAQETGDGWHLEPHVCRHCFGRLASEGGEVLCTNCGASVWGDVMNLCACGLTIRREGPRGVQQVSAGLRCQSNPKPTPEFPSLYVAAPAKPDC